MPPTRRPPVVTLTTDFGLDDWFVGTMKGVLLSRCPNVRIIDLTHAVPPGDVRAGAFALRAGYAHFPRGSVHVAIVDPGVGSDRKAIAARTPNASFVGPDNGVLSWALAAAGTAEVRRLENPELWLTPVSATFHGRDVFAPVAAHLASGGAFAGVGPRASDWVRLPWPEPRTTPGGWAGEVVYVDRFGNAITNLPSSLAGGVPQDWRLGLTDGHDVPLGAFYQAVAKGLAVAVGGSNGLIEIAVNGGSASGVLGLRCGDVVTLKARGGTGASRRGPSGAGARRPDRPRTVPNRRP